MVSPKILVTCRPLHGTFSYYSLIIVDAVDTILYYFKHGYSHKEIIQEIFRVNPVEFKYK